MPSEGWQLQPKAEALEKADYYGFCLSKMIERKLERVGVNILDA